MCSAEGDLIKERKLGVTPSSPHDGLGSLGEVTKPLWAIIGDFSALKIYGVLFFQVLLCHVSFLGIEFLSLYIF